MLDENKTTFKQTRKLETAGLKSCWQLPTNPHRLVQPLLNLYIQFLKEPTRGKLLAVLFLILPWNLGKHLEVIGSFVNGLLVPYLIPVLYLQDALIILIVVLGLLEKNSIGVFGRLFFLFMTASLLSTSFADRTVPSVYFCCRLGVYFLFFVTSRDLFTRSFIRRSFFTLGIANLLLLCILGLTQFNKQASVFNNYLIFGEQPYNIYTPFIAKERFDGVTKIPPYGLFEHPNIFAGYLVIFLTFFSSCLLGLRAGSLLGKIGWVTFRLAGIGLLALGLHVLSLTKSTTAWVAMLSGLLALIFFRLDVWGRLKNRSGCYFARERKTIPSVLCRRLVVLIGVGIVITGLAFPCVEDVALKVLPTDSNQSTLSVQRRTGLLNASYQMFLEKPFFGWGINSFTYSSQSYYKDSVLVRFYQPVHNIFALVLVETGIFGFFFFLSLIFYALYRTAKYKNPLYSVVLMQIIFLASFDHYFFTIHQTLVLFILTLLLALTYTETTDCL